MRADKVADKSGYGRSDAGPNALNKASFVATRNLSLPTARRPRFMKALISEDRRFALLLVGPSAVIMKVLRPTGDRQVVQAGWAMVKFGRRSAVTRRRRGDRACAYWLKLCLSPNRSREQNHFYVHHR